MFGDNFRINDYSSINCTKKIKRKYLTINNKKYMKKKIQDLNLNLTNCESVDYQMNDVAQDEVRLTW